VTITQHFVFEEKKPPRKWVRWVLTFTPFLTIGATSWFLGGNTAWEVGNLLFGGVVGFTLLGCLLATMLELEARIGSSPLWLPALLAVVVIDKLEIGRQRAVSYLLAAWALWAGIGLLLPLTTLDFYDQGRRYPCPTRIRYLGREIVSADVLDHHSVQVRGRFWRRWLTIETHGLRGWTPRHFTVYEGYNRSTVRLEEFDTRTFYIDNRNHGAATIACGEVEIEVPANSHLERTVAAPLLSPSEVRIDGKMVGSVEGPHVLVDVLGTRSYIFREIHYESDLDRAARAFRPAGVVQPPKRELPREALYRTKHLHRLFRVAD
jgi:hypothetical protein